jgi:alpha-beta hydrolase superfamily lysophospholipase
MSDAAPTATGMRGADASRVAGGVPQSSAVKLELPAPTGPYAVGRQSFHWTDHSRKESLTDDPNDNRELMVHIWYPAEPAAKTAASPYIPNLELLMSGLDDSQYSILSKVQSHTFARANLLPARPRYPVLIFSHGNQMSSFLYTAIIEDLASHGYIVATIDHPYEAIFTVFPDGRVVTYSDDKRPKSDGSSFQEELIRYLRERIDKRAADIVFVIDQLVELNADKNSQFRERLDLASVGVFGHSNGGTAAAQACQMDKRIKACINLDGRAAAGPFYPDANGSGPEQPFMYLAKPLRDLNDKELAEQKITREQFEQERSKTVIRENELMSSVKAGSYRGIIQDATHESFSDEPLLISRPASGADANNRKTMKVVQEYTLAFFDGYLKDKKPTKLKRMSNRYSGVTVERFGPALR